jgi:hypothetical protein
MLTAFYDEEIISVGEDTLTLAIDFRAIDFIEHIAGESGTITPMPNVVAMLFADPPPLSLAGKVLRGLLLRHHEDVSLDQCAGLMFGEHGNRVARAMFGLITRAMNLETPKEEKGKNPPKRRGASKTS